MWCRKQPDTDIFHAGLRYTETVNTKRDHWVSNILYTYGFRVAEKSNKRSDVRHGVMLPLLIAAHDGKRFRGTVLNISMGGLLGQVGGDGLRANQRIDARIGPVSGLDAIGISGHIVRCRVERATGTSTIGLAFDLLTQEQRNQLIRCLSTLSRQFE